MAPRGHPPHPPGPGATDRFFNDYLKNCSSVLFRFFFAMHSQCLRMHCRVTPKLKLPKMRVAKYFNVYQQRTQDFLKEGAKNAYMVASRLRIIHLT